MQLKHFNAVTKYIALALIVCLTFISVTSPVYSLADTKTEYDDNNKELERLRNEQSQLSSELNDLNSELDNAGEKLNSINDRIADTQEQIDSLNENISNMEIEKQHQFDTMKLRIQYMYENSDYSFLDVLLSSSSMADLLQRNEYVSRISQYDRKRLDGDYGNEYDRKMLEELSSLIAVLNQNQLSLQTNMTELVSLKEQSIAESNNIKRLIASKQSKIDTNSENIAKAEALALEYEERIRQEEIQRQLEEIKKMTPSVDEVINNTPIAYDTSDLAMVSAMIECEAANQPYEGKLAVGSVIVNRVNSPKFGNTIQSVLYAPSQFSPVASGRFAIVLARGANAECTRAANEVLNGHITIAALYFHVYDSTVDKGGTIIGDHVFY